MIEALLKSLLAETSRRRRGWAEAALAELPHIGGFWARAGWTLDAVSLIAGDTLERTLMPWINKEGEQPPYGFAARLGFLAMLPAVFVLALSALDKHWAATIFAPLAGHLSERTAALTAAIAIPILVLSGLIVALWSNIGVVLKGEHLGGLVYSIGLRLKPWNIAVIVLAAALAKLLIGQALAALFVFAPHWPA